LQRATGAKEEEMKKRLSHRTLVKLAIAICVVAAAAGTASAAVAAPFRQYSVECERPQYWNQTIRAQVLRIDPQPGVGMTTLNSNGTITRATDQWIYFELWAYSYKYGRWYTSPTKRTLNGFPGSWNVQAWSSQIGRWVDAGDFVSGAGYLGSNDPQIGTYDVGIHPARGSGAWHIEVRTYWAPPTYYVNAYDAIPSAPAGGIDVFDASPNTCIF
jgi:hypothetical protein